MDELATASGGRSTLHPGSASDSLGRTAPDRTGTRLYRRTLGPLGRRSRRSGRLQVFPVSRSALPRDHSGDPQTPLHPELPAQSHGHGSAGGLRLVGGVFQERHRGDGAVRGKFPIHRVRRTVPTGESAAESPEHSPLLLLPSEVRAVEWTGRLGRRARG